MTTFGDEIDNNNNKKNYFKFDKNACNVNILLLYKYIIII